MVKPRQKKKQLIADEILPHAKLGTDDGLQIEEREADYRVENSPTVKNEESAKVEPDMVTELIKKSRNQTSPGPDKINYKLLNISGQGPKG